MWCHWPVPVEAVASILPPVLSPETFDGSAWIGLIPFAALALGIALYTWFHPGLRQQGADEPPPVVEETAEGDEVGSGSRSGA